MVTTRSGYDTDMTPEEIKAEVKRIKAEIRLAENKIKGLGELEDHQEMKRLSNEYYRLCNKIIESNALSTAEEKEFDSFKPIIDDILRISSGFAIINNGLNRLRKKEAIDHDNKITRKKLDDMKVVVSCIPNMEEQLVELERQFILLSIEQDDKNDVAPSEGTTDAATTSSSNQTSYNEAQPFWWDYGYQPRTGPKIEAKRLKKYDGDPIGYPVFRKTISHYLINNPQLRGNLNKLMEIRDLLPEKHQYILDRVDQVEPDMAEVLKILDSHYGGRSRVIPALKARIRAAVRLPLRPTEKEWETMTETVILVRNTLRTTGLETEEFSLISPIMAKIDRIHFTNIGQEEEVTLKQIEDYLKHGWNRERTIGSQIDPEDIAAANNPRKSVVVNNRNKNVMVSSAKTKCLFQDGDHATADCTLDAEQRKKVMIDNRMCFRCGYTNHQSRNCNRTVKCTICGRCHLSFLCRDYKRSNMQTSSVVNGSNPSETVPKQVATSSSSSTNTPVMLTMNEKSLHKTIVTTINNRKVRILFDDGAGVSFISKRLADLWQLPYENVDPIHMDTLSNSNPTTTGDQCVKLSLPIWNGHQEDLNFRLNEKLNKLRFDCLSVHDQEQLNNIGIEFLDEPSAVDLLIGLDNINLIQLNDERRITDKIVAKKTTLGWLVFGLTKTENILLTLYQNDMQETSPEYDVDDDSKAAMEKFITNYCNDDNVRYDESRKRYSIKLPFINNVDIDSNFVAAKNITTNMIRRMNEKRREEYQALLTDLEQKEIIESTKIITNDGYHMPHFVVAREDKNTTKLRMVFHASHGSKPLNKAIFKGITSWSIIRSILTFRMKPIGVISDIQSAFHNIEVQQEHRKFIKFLWMNNDDQLICYQFNRLPFGLSSSPFVLYAVINHHIKKYQDKYPNAVKMIRDGLYVDDMIFSADDAIEVESIKQQCIEIFSDASMNLRKWRTSDEDLNRQWNDDLAESKVLGMEWTNDDHLQIAIPEFKSNEPITKRNVVSYLASIYDPFGFVLATSFKLKLLIHEAWMKGIDWDEEMPNNLARDVLKAVVEIDKLKTFKFKRFMFDQTVSTYDLMIFVDASKNAIGIAAYVSDGRILSLVYAKSKLIKHRKIVTGELLALSYGANVASSLKEMINPKRIVMFSDSMDNVHRLTQDINKFPYPVAVHLYNIKMKVNEIRHIPGNINPADAFTRGVNVDQLNGLHRCNLNDIVNDDDTNVMMITTTVLTTANYDLSNIDLDAELSYDDWIKLIDEQPSDWKKTIDTNENSLTILIKLIQQEFITDDMRKNIPMFIDDNQILRCQSRFDNADFTYDEKYPLILPKCAFTTSFLTNLHEQDEHGSVNYTLSNLRTKYFVPKARQLLIRIKNKCSKCRALQAKPLDVFLGCPPPERLNRSQPFEHIGVDLFELKTEPKAIGMIFTCATTRSVHFELLEDATAQSICNAFMVFSDLNRIPMTIFSDNGPNLKKFSQLLKSALHKLNYEFKWHFNTPASPFRGGFFESLIKTMKKGFYCINWQRKLDRNDIRRALYRIQAIMNGRPLIHDKDTILTPNHLRFGYNPKGPLVPPKRGLPVEPLLSYWRGTQKHIDAAWRIYRDIYLKGLRSFYRNGHTYQHMAVGDKVLMIDDHLPVSLWKIATVTNTIPDKRGIVRTYEVELDKRKYRRPAQRLAPLEGAGMDKNF
ncbi:uncharacterized protein LOC142645329 [Dermatophagoides pteronyssinus]|uniref:uncharacterized protein LOC142645329 n=1 Tax=Dermatophagoides pteronyssinus TaxID=6956 RepID=UPI003F66C007